MPKLKITKNGKTQTIKVDKFQIIEEPLPKINKAVIKEYEKLYYWMPEPFEHKGMIFKICEYNYDPIYNLVEDLGFNVAFKDKNFERQIAEFQLTKDIQYLLREWYIDWLNAKLEKQLNKKFKEFYNKNKKAFPPNTSFEDAIEIMEDAQ